MRSLLKGGQDRLHLNQHTQIHNTYKQYGPPIQLNALCVPFYIAHYPKMAGLPVACHRHPP